MTDQVFASTAGAPSQEAAPVSLVGDQPLRVVFDTNVLLSLFVFTDSRFAPLLQAVDDGRWLAFSSDACFAEFERVLGYPVFALSAERQAECASAWRHRLALLPLSVSSTITLPQCKDRDDQKFLELARDAQADWLVTADKALLKLARREKLRGVFQILTPEVAISLLSSLHPHARLSAAVG